MMTGSRLRKISLSRQIFVRVMATLVLTMLAMGVAAFFVYRATYEASTQRRHQYAMTFYSEQIARIEEDWTSHIMSFAATVGFFRLLDDVKANESRFTSFLTASNILADFSSIVVMDAGNNVIYALGGRFKHLTDRPEARHDSWSAGKAWHYEDGTLYRVFTKHVVTNAGPVYLIFFRAMDNAILYGNTIPQSDLFLVWQGAVVANSRGSIESKTEQTVLASLSGTNNDNANVLLPWDQGGGETPVLVASLHVTPPFNITDILNGSGLFFLTFLLLSWLIIGRWVIRMVRNITLLSTEARQFAATRSEDKAKMAVLMNERFGGELTALAVSMNDMMQTVLEQEAESARHEENLRQRNEEINLLLDSAGEGFYGIDAEGRCTFINRACLEMFGYDSPEDLLGRNLHELTHHTRIDGTPYPGDECRIREARQNGVGMWVADEIFWRRNGTSFPAEYSAFPIKDNGQIVGTVVSIMDTTERSEALESLRRQAIDHDIIAQIMKLSLMPIPLNDMLEQTLKLVLTSHDLGLQSRGSIFLRQGDELVLVAQQGLHEHLLTACATVPFGWCLCGRAASTKAVVYAQSVDHRHDIRFPEMSPHGHYCMPIMGDDEVLGVINLYVSADHGGSEHELRFVNVVADTLAGVIRHHRVQEERHRGEERLRSLVENAGDCILVHDFDGQIISANRRACKELGYTRDALEQAVLGDIDVEFDAAEHAQLWKAMTPGVPVVMTSHYRRKDGSQFPVEIHLGYYETGQLPLVVVLAHNITERLQAEERIKHMASHDALTGLPNRSLFIDRLTMAAIAAKRSGHRVAVLFIDLDGFKAVNDTMGHAAGDSLLKQVSARLAACVRESDTVARLGGDEFTILMADVIDPQASVRVAELILKTLGKPFPIEDNEDAHIGASIGVAQSPGDGETTETLLAAADRAMYAVKESGKNHYILASSLAPEEKQ